MNAAEAGWGRRLVPLLLGGLCLGLGWGSVGGTVGGWPTAAAATTTADKLQVWVSILPQAFFLERIGGDRVAVRVLVGPGESPSSFDPTARQMAALGEAKAFFSIGVPMETGTLGRLRKNFPSVPIIDSRTGPAGSLPTPSPHISHGAAGKDQGHVHDEGLDPHIWLSIPLAKGMAEVMTETLVELDPTNTSAYRQNLTVLLAELDQTDAEIREILAAVRGRQMLVFHPAFGHFAREYGLRQVAIERGGQAPSPKHLAELFEEAQEQGISAIFVQPQFSATLADNFAEAAGINLVELDPLAHDYLTNLKEMAWQIRKALATQP